MPGIETSRAHANLQKSLSGHLIPPDRLQSQSQASMLSDILNSYADAQPPSPGAYHNGQNELEAEAGSYNARSTTPLLDHPVLSPGLSEHSAASGSTTPPPASPRTPNTTPPRPFADTGVKRALVGQSVSPTNESRRSRSGQGSTSKAKAGVDQLSTGAVPMRMLVTSAQNQSPSLKHKPEVDGLRRLSGEQEIHNNDHAAEWDTNHMRNVTVRKTRRQSGKAPATNGFADPMEPKTQALQDRRLTSTTPDTLKHQHAETDLRHSHHRALSGSSSHSRNGSAQTPREANMNRWSTGSRSSAVVQATVIFPEPHTPKLRHVSKNGSLRSDASRQSNRNSLVSETTSSPLHTHATKLRRGSVRTNGSPQSQVPDEEPGDDVKVARKSTAADVARELLRQDMVNGSPPRIVTDDGLTTRRVQVVPPKDRPTRAPTQETVGSFRSATSGSTQVFHDAASHLGHQPSFESLHSQYKHQGDFSSDQRPPASLAHLNTSPDENRRVSFDPMISHSELSDRHARFSPLSTRSEVTEAYEVQEAATVDIYPHSNGSLLVVHHTNSGDLLGQMNGHKALPNIGRYAGSNAVKLGPLPERIDSPWNNPRQPPSPPKQPTGPPMVAVIPPTPARELDDEDETVSSTYRPVRRASLLERARRYSDTVMQPLTGSLRRKRGTGHATKGESSNLHPNWRPRNYDYGNDGYDSYDEALGDDDGMRQRPRPVTSDGHPPSTTWRRGGSLRGFLLGNTLGIERGPTNKRKPQIILPSQRKQTQANPPSSYQPISVRASARHSGEKDRPSRESREPKRRRDSSLTRLMSGWRDRKISKEERAAEARRDELRSNIRMYPNADDEDGA